LNLQRDNFGLRSGKALAVEDRSWNTMMPTFGLQGRLKQMPRAVFHIEVS
jgi:hypothetical protein